MKTESKATHTPGPWRIGDAGRTVFGAKVPGAMPATVAYMPPVTPRVDAGERKANRDIMAAAPELLAALNRALPWLGRLIADGGHLNSVAPNDAIGAMNQAQAAIDKATGNV